MKSLLKIRRSHKSLTFVRSEYKDEVGCFIKMQKISFASHMDTIKIHMYSRSDTYSRYSAMYL